MIPKILVVAATKVQLDLACRNIGFLRAARRHQSVIRVYSIADIRGRAHCRHLYLLPGCDTTVHDLEEIRAYWHRVQNELVEVTELQVLGDEPCELAPDSPMQPALAADLLEIKRAGKAPLAYEPEHETEFEYQVRKGMIP